MTESRSVLCDLTRKIARTGSQFTCPGSQFTHEKWNCARDFSHQITVCSSRYYPLFWRWWKRISRSWKCQKNWDISTNYINEIKEQRSRSYWENKKEKKEERIERKGRKWRLSTERGRRAPLWFMVHLTFPRCAHDNLVRSYVVKKWIDFLAKESQVTSSYECVKIIFSWSPALYLKYLWRVPKLMFYSKTHLFNRTRTFSQFCLRDHPYITLWV